MGKHIWLVMMIYDFNICSIGKSSIHGPSITGNMVGGFKHDFYFP